MVKELELNKRYKLDVLFEILYLVCVRKLVEFLKKGDVEGIIYEWNNIVCCVFFDEDKMWEIIGKYLLESLDKVKEY